MRVLEALSRGIQFAFSTRFPPDATRLPRQISQGFQNVTISPWDKKKDEPPGLRSIRDLGRSILPSFRHILPSRRPPARRGKTKKGQTARCCNVRRRGGNMALHSRRLSHFTLIRFFLCALSRSAQRFLSVRAWSPSNHGHTFGKMISFLGGSIARAKTYPAHVEENYFSRQRAQKGRGGMAHSYQARYPTSKRRLRVDLFDIDEGPIHR